MKKKVPAIEKVDKIFNYLYYKEAVTQAEIARELDISKASVNRILFTLLELKYLRIENKKYFLGEKFYFFSNKHQKYSLIKNISYSYLEELSLRFKETFKISILDENKIRTIAKVESSDYIKISISENAIYPLHAGAASKLLICQLSNIKLDKILGKILPKYTENTITNINELKEELIQINSKKISFDNKEHSEKIKAVAVPILNKNNRIIAAMSCPCFADEWSEEKIVKIIEQMQKSCNEIGKKIENLNS